MKGARKLGEEMLQTYGEDAFAFVVDEGGMHDIFHIETKWHLIGTV